MLICALKNLPTDPTRKRIKRISFTILIVGKQTIYYKLNFCCLCTHTLKRKTHHYSIINFETEFELANLAKMYQYWYVSVLDWIGKNMYKSDRYWIGNRILYRYTPNIYKFYISYISYIFISFIYPSTISTRTFSADNID